MIGDYRCDDQGLDWTTIPADLDFAGSHFFDVTFKSAIVSTEKMSMLLRPRPLYFFCLISFLVPGVSGALNRFDCAKVFEDNLKYEPLIAELQREIKKPSGLFKGIASFLSTDQEPARMVAVSKLLTGFEIPNAVVKVKTNAGISYRIRFLSGKSHQLSRTASYIGVPLEWDPNWNTSAAALQCETLSQIPSVWGTREHSIVVSTDTLIWLLKSPKRTTPVMRHELVHLKVATRRGEMKAGSFSGFIEGSPVTGYPRLAIDETPAYIEGMEAAAQELSDLLSFDLSVKKYDEFVFGQLFKSLVHDIRTLSEISVYMKEVFGSLIEETRSRPLLNLKNDRFGVYFERHHLKSGEKLSYVLSPEKKELSAEWVEMKLKEQFLLYSEISDLVDSFDSRLGKEILDKKNHFELENQAKVVEFANEIHDKARKLRSLVFPLF